MSNNDKARQASRCWARLGLPAAALLGGCASGPAPQPAMVPIVDTVVVVDTVEITRGIDPNEELEERIALLQLRMLERDALIEELQTQVGGAIQEVVRAMARLQTLASRAEAASAMAEAEIALEALGASGGAAAAESAQAAHFLQMSTAEFNNQNYGGALYLATQARGVARTGQMRLAVGDDGDRQPGEALFALPLRLRTVRRSNVRAGPALGSEILFTLDAGVPLTGYSYTDQWVRVTDARGQSGWIFHSLIGSRPRGDP